MKTKNRTPRNADEVSVRGKSGKHTKSNYRNYSTINLDRDLFLIRAQFVKRKMVRAMRRLAFLYKGGTNS